MTPFDPFALVAMLNAFYPSVTRTSLERAFRERPEYFAGGYLFGRLSDVLVLPDGRAFDIVYAAWTVQSRWQAIEITNAEPGADDPFALDPGPLVEIDVDATAPAPSEPVFVPLVSGALGELATADDRMGSAETAVREGAAPLAQDGGLGTMLEDAEWQHEMYRRALEGANVGELVERTDGLGGSIDGYRDELPAPDAAPEPLNPETAPERWKKEKPDPEEERYRN